MSAPLPARRHVLAARLPVRPLALAAVTAVVGAGLMVLGAAVTQPVLTVLGGVLLVVGLVWESLVLVLTLRSRVTVECDDTTWGVSGPRGTQTGRWADVRAVRVAETGREMLIESGEEAAVVHVLLPPTAPEDDVAAMYRDLVERLDRSRGYRSL